MVQCGLGENRERARKPQLRHKVDEDVPDGLSRLRDRGSVRGEVGGAAVPRGQTRQRLGWKCHRFFREAFDARLEI